MSKNLKRALMGFAAGALGATQRYFETQRAQEAERLKEERLAAIRASERAEDRAFQTAETDRQIAAQEARDEREAERRMEELKAQGAQRVRELGIQGANQLAYADRANAPRESPTRYLVERGGRTIEVPASDLGKDGDKIIAGITNSGGIVPLISRGGSSDSRSYSGSQSGQPKVDVAPPAPALPTAATATSQGNYVQQRWQDQEPEPWSKFVPTSP